MWILDLVEQCSAQHILQLICVLIFLILIFWILNSRRRYTFCFCHVINCPLPALLLSLYRCRSIFANRQQDPGLLPSCSSCPQPMIPMIMAMRLVVITSIYDDAAGTQLVMVGPLTDIELGLCFCIGTPGPLFGLLGVPLWGPWAQKARPH